MPWKRLSWYKRHNFRGEAALVCAALLVGMLSCCVGRLIWEKYSAYSEKYAKYTAILSRYSAKDIEALKAKYAGR